MKTIEQKNFTEERALFFGEDLCLRGVVFDVGESPLKHSKNITAEECLFRWRYPLWYGKNITAKGCSFFEPARAGMWYTDQLTLEGCMVQSPKTLRRCNGVTLRKVSFSNADETLWSCKDVRLEHVTVSGEYFGMNSENVVADDLVLYGKYCFDGAKNIEIRNGRFLSKDCFWNAENVTIYDSFISCEYLAWNAKNVRLVRCTVESLQGLCYVENLKMEDCKLINTTLAFEYSTVDATILSGVDSVLNPSGGTIRAERIGEVILEKDRIDPGKTKIIVKE